jgi:hypothetical protein
VRATGKLGSCCRHGDQASAARLLMVQGCARAFTSAFWARMRGTSHAVAVLPGRASCVARHFEQHAVRGASRPWFFVWCLMPKPTAVAGGCALVAEGRCCSSSLGSLPGGHGRRTPGSGVDAILFTVHPKSTLWAPEIRPINISRSKTKEGKGYSGTAARS